MELIHAIKTRNRRIAFWIFNACCFLLLLSPAFASETVPGDACPTQYQFRLTGGPETTGIENLMMCNGSTWQQRMTFTSAGYVGIGTSTPAGILDVQGGEALSGAGTSIVLKAQNAIQSGASGFVGGNVSITAGKGSSGTSGGNITFAAGLGGALGYSPGATMTLYGGKYYGPPGSIIIGGDLGNNGYGAIGKIQISSPTTNAGAALTMTAGTAGSGNYAGGDIVIDGGTKSGTAKDGNVLLASTRGYVGVGTASPVTKLDLSGTLKIGNGGEACSGTYAGGVLYSSAYLYYCDGSVWQQVATGSGATAAGSNTQIQFNSGGALGASSSLTWNNATPALTVTGDINYTGILVDTSDRRLKDDITPLDSRGSMLEKLGQLGTYSFMMKSDPKRSIEFGVMAQELQGVFPELVRTDESTPERYMAVNYMGLIAPMIRAMQEQQAIIERQQQQIDHLLAVVGEPKAARPHTMPTRAQGMRRFND